MRFVELYATFHVQSRRGKLPHRAVQLCRAESRGGHRVEEVRPGDFAGLVWLVGIVEECGEDFEGTFSDGYGGLDVRNVSGGGMVVVGLSFLWLLGGWSPPGFDLLFWWCRILGTADGVYPPQKNPWWAYHRFAPGVVSTLWSVPVDDQT